MSVAVRPAVPFVDLAASAGPDLQVAFDRVVRSGRWILGEEVAAFERELAAFCGVPHAVGVASGTDALQLVLRAVGVGAGDDVLVPGHTAVATWMAVALTGARPVGVDVDDRTLTLDPSDLDAALTTRTRAVVPVHLAGRVADLPAILPWARERGLAVVEDAAQAHGALQGADRVGALADAATFSFYPTKNLGCVGDGGAVTTRDTALAERVRLLRQYGWRDRRDSELVGLNSRLDELQAAFLRARLPGLDAANARRRAIAGRYLAGLRDTPGLTCPGDAPGHVWHLFVVRHPRRDDLRSLLARHGVGTLVHYELPPNLTTAFAADAVRPLPVTEAAAHQVLSLPLHPQLADEQVEAVVAAVVAACDELA